MELFYKTMSEGATLSCIREHTSIPVPRAIAHSSTTDNELGLGWILMVKILKDLVTRDGHGGEDRETRVVARHVKQLCDKISFDVIGNLYFCENLLDGTMRTVPTIADRLDIGVIVATFAAEENSRLPGNFRPYTMTRSMWLRSQMQRPMT